MRPLQDLTSLLSTWGLRKQGLSLWAHSQVFSLSGLFFWNPQGRDGLTIP